VLHRGGGAGGLGGGVRPSEMDEAVMELVLEDKVRLMGSGREIMVRPLVDEKFTPPSNSIHGQAIAKMPGDAFFWGVWRWGSDANKTPKGQKPCNMAFAPGVLLLQRAVVCWFLKKFRNHNRAWVERPSTTSANLVVVRRFWDQCTICVFAERCCFHHNPDPTLFCFEDPDV